MSAREKYELDWYQLTSYVVHVIAKGLIDL
jgi:hypothetical protein